MVELAYNYSPTKDYGVNYWWASPKYDGVRGIFDVAQNGLFTRQEKRIWGCRTIEESCRACVASFKDIGIDVKAIEGELYQNGADFPTISGEVSKFQCDDKNLILKVFAVSLPDQSIMNTADMVANLPQKDEYSLLEPVEYVRIPNTPDNVFNFLNLNNYSQEGIVLRHENISYTDGRSHNLLKVKKMYTSQLTITSINQGSGQFANSLGSINVSGMVNDNIATSKVGTGFTTEERDAIWNNQPEYLGKDVEILYMGVTSGGSLRQPVFVRVVD